MRLEVKQKRPAADQQKCRILMQPCGLGESRTRLWNPNPHIRVSYNDLTTSLPARKGAQSFLSHIESYKPLQAPSGARLPADFELELRKFPKVFWALILIPRVSNMLRFSF